jgi:benzodiazapine receptor
MTSVLEPLHGKSAAAAPTSPGRPLRVVAPPVRRHSGLVLFGFLVLCEAAGLLGVPFTARGSASWYDRLDKPPFNPPSWVFGPVWTTLYALMAVSAWLVWRSHAVPPLRREALTVFAVQLVLNAVWTPIFFGAEHAGIALVVIVAMLLAIVAMIAMFGRVDRRAAWLNAPYLAWVSFATVLNASIVVLN